MRLIVGIDQPFASRRSDVAQSYCPSDLFSNTVSQRLDPMQTRQVPEGCKTARLCNLSGEHLPLSPRGV